MPKPTKEQQDLRRRGPRQQGLMITDPGGNPKVVKFPNDSTKFLDGTGGFTVPPGSGGAPTDADYVVKTAHGSLSAERVLTDNTEVTWDWSVGGVVKAVVAAASIVYAKLQNVSATNRFLGRKTAGAGTIEELSANDASTILDGATDPFVRRSTRIRVVKFTFPGTPAAGTKARQRCPVSGTIIRADIYSDVSCSAVVDIWKDTWANYPPTIADTITASAKPTLSSADHNEDTTLTGWSKTVTAGDVFIGNLDSNTGGGEINCELWIQET